MLVNTAVFGPMEIADDHILHMERGPYGFDENRTFALLEQEDDGVVFRWLQAVEEEIPCFVVFDPYEVISGYTPELEPSDLKALGCENAQELRFYVIAVVPEDYRKITVNLKSPVAVNPKTNQARQVILTNVDYPIRFPLVPNDELAQAL